MSDRQPMGDQPTFESVNDRLHEIFELVSDESTSLDEALNLYEEAVKLGLAACDLSEQDIEPYLAEVTEDEIVDADQEIVVEGESRSAASV